MTVERKQEGEKRRVWKALSVLYKTENICSRNQGRSLEKRAPHEWLGRIAPKHPNSILPNEGNAIPNERREEEHSEMELESGLKTSRIQTLTLTTRRA